MTNIDCFTKLLRPTRRKRKLVAGIEADVLNAVLKNYAEFNITPSDAIAIFKADPTLSAYWRMRVKVPF